MKDWEVNWFGEQFFTLATAANIRATKKAAYVVERMAKRLLSVGGYVKYKGSKSYISSQPGSPPNLRTNVLRSSVSTEIKVKRNVVEGWVGSDLHKMEDNALRQGISLTESGVEYGYYLEVGTRKMAKRPWLRPALLHSKDLINKIFYTAFTKG